MLRTTAIAATFSLAMMALGGVSTAQAAPITSLAKPEIQSTVEHVQFRRYCRRWRWECRSRWGFGWRFQRCMARHGC